MEKENNYWKCEYENLRRKKNKEAELRNIQVSKFVNKTYELLKGLGLSHSDIMAYYCEDYGSR